MEKREQRARRDRRRDGNRNTFQNDPKRETVKQQDSSVDKKKSDTQNVEVSNKKNTSENKTIEDDPLRFANLKRETDEIAALKAKKPYKRQVFSNWAKYEVPLPSENESQAVDFETLLHAPQSGSFRFKSEQQWETGSFGQFGELFTPDADLLLSGLTSLPFYRRLGIDKTLFLEDEIERMDRSAKANYVAYEKLSKSKPKPKIAACDVFKVDQAEKYSVVDEPNGPNVELCTSTSKPVFSVEECPEASPVELSVPARAAGSTVLPDDPDRESKRESERVPEGAARDFLFGKPPPSSYGAARNPSSQEASRESTPLRDGGPNVASQEFHFERAPPPSANLRSPFHSRESTPAKETASTAPSRDFGSRKPQAPGFTGQVASREGTPDSGVPSVRDSDTKQKMRDDRPAVKGVTSPAGVRFENVSSREGTPARERQPCEEDSALRETFPLQKVADDNLRVTAIASQEVEPTINEIPSKLETSEREEVTRKEVPDRSGADTRGELMHKQNPYESDAVSGQKADENGQICTENDSYSKKRGKSDIRKAEGQQRGGGRHGRRKKGQHGAARDGEQLPVEGRDICQNTTEPEAEGAATIATRADSPLPEETVREEPHLTKGVKKKPERPPPPAVSERPPPPAVSERPPPPPAVSEHKQSPPPASLPSTTPAVIQQTENKVSQPVVAKPEEPKAQKVAAAAISSDVQAQPSQMKAAQSAKQEPVSKERKPGGRKDDDGLNFLMSLRGQKTGGVSEVEVAKSAAGTAVSRSAIEEDELKESQKPKPPVIATEKKEDLEDWLDSMLDD